MSRRSDDWSLPELTTGLRRGGLFALLPLWIRLPFGILFLSFFCGVNVMAIGGQAMMRQSMGSRSVEHRMDRRVQQPMADPAPRHVQGAYYPEDHVNDGPVVVEDEGTSPLFWAVVAFGSVVVGLGALGLVLFGGSTRDDDEVELDHYTGRPKARSADRLADLAGDGDDIRVDW